MYLVAIWPGCRSNYKITIIILLFLRCCALCICALTLKVLLQNELHDTTLQYRQRVMTIIATRNCNTAVLMSSFIIVSAGYVVCLDINTVPSNWPYIWKSPKRVFVTVNRGRSHLTFILKPILLDSRNCRPHVKDRVLGKVRQHIPDTCSVKKLITSKTENKKDVT